MSTKPKRASGHTSLPTDESNTVELADLDDYSHDSISRAYEGTCCGYPSKNACVKGTLTSPKFWFAFVGFTVFLGMTIGILTGLHRSISLQGALAYWTMAEVEKIENLTKDCICAQWLCQATNDTRMVNNDAAQSPTDPDRIRKHARSAELSQETADTCIDAYLKYNRLRYMAIAETGLDDTNTSCAPYLSQACSPRVIAKLCTIAA
jgi:hypothetical protein